MSAQAKRGESSDSKKIVKQKQKRPVGRPVSTLERKAIVQHNSLSTSSRKGNIPLLRSVFRKGTQTPTLRLKLALGAVSSNGSGVINITYDVALVNTILSTSWDDVFDEFRIVKGFLRYIPFQNHSISSLAPRDIVAQIDYDDSTAATSKNSCWDSDTAVAKNTQEEWDLPIFQPDFVPDLQWYNCQTAQATAMGTWKFYADGCTNSSAYGEVFGWIDVQFRCTN
jgi:hypothetical protein